MPTPRLTPFAQKIKDMESHGFVIGGRVISIGDGFMVQGPRGESMQQYAWPASTDGHLKAVQVLARKHFKEGVLHRDRGHEVDGPQWAQWGFTEKSQSGYSVLVDHYVVFVQKQNAQRAA